MFCDLHVHSCFSDGTDTPTQLIRQAQSLGISALALCDHNTLSGLPEFLSAAAGTGVTAIPGIEFYGMRLANFKRIAMSPDFRQGLVNMLKIWIITLRKN